MPWSSAGEMENDDDAERDGAADQEISLSRTGLRLAVRGLFPWLEDGEDRRGEQNSEGGLLLNCVARA